MTTAAIIDEGEIDGGRGRVLPSVWVVSILRQSMHEPDTEFLCRIPSCTKIALAQKLLAVPGSAAPLARLDVNGLAGS